MIRPSHTVLVVSSSVIVIERLQSLCEQCGLPDLSMVVCEHVADAEAMLEHKSFSLTLLDLANGVSLSFLDYASSILNPKPVVAIIGEGSSTTIINALRAGADDVFVVEDLDLSPKLFIYSMKRQLRRALYIEESKRLKDSLERSLDELRADHHAAQHVQQNLLPPRHQTINGLVVEYTLKPSLLLSGDFVDAIEINDHLIIFYLADVSGHGASSALVTVLLKNLTHRLLRNYKRHSSFDILSPVLTLERINREMLLTGMGKHMTMFVGLLDTQTSKLTYATGGHHPMPILSCNESSSFLKGRGMPVGLFEKPEFEEHQLDLPQVFSLTLFSDGVLEILKGSSLKEKENWLLSTLQPGYIESSQLTEMIEEGFEDVRPDDVAIMTVSRA
ncbi:PP2C family protein-serine/threonine phosphatase [Nitrincola alkalisediminis]|nr:SpoIIE family protein phosphatase [Nitrincola alkalisediminis]